MKRISVVRSAFFFGILLFLAFLTPEPGNHFAGDAAAQSGVNASSFPSDMECTPQPYYRYRADAKPGREMALTLKGGALSGKVAVEITASGKIERTEAVSADGVSFKVLLPPDLAVKNEAVVTLTLRQGDKTLSKTVTVPAMRQWTVYIYPHSHVDIGYTNTQANVELLHITNMMEGIKLAEATTTYPAGAQYKWNPEVTWPVERYWQKSTAAEQTRIINAIKSGQMCLDSSYLNLNTSVCNEEELFQIFRFSREMQQRSGVPIDSFQQMDIPGMSWGLIPVMAQQGVRYIMSWSNGGTRIGNNRLLDEKPFWWIAPDGISKVLFFQPGTYANSGSMTKGGETGRPWFGQRDPDKVPPVIKTGNANVDFTKAILARERPDYPYDFYVVSWSLWDNCPLDADIPDAVKTWNDQYAYPHLEIASGHEIMSMIETKYGDTLPSVKGDFTEYWTDGLGTAARLTALNRNAKERLVQAETLWTMLRPGLFAPRSEFDEAWRYIALGSEHTWCAENPTEPFFHEALFKVKQGYFREADERAQRMYDNALAPATDRSKGALGPAEGPANGGVAVFNTHSWTHGGLVLLTKAESQKGDRVIDEHKNDVPSQRLSTGELAFLASDVPAFGSRHYRVVEGASQFKNGCTVKDNVLENALLRVKLDAATGNITELVQKGTAGNLVDTTISGGLNAFRWLPGDGDAQGDAGAVIETVESGPLVVELRVSSKAPGCRALARSVRLVHGQPWVEITNVVDKLPLVEKDGVHFGFGFDIPESVTRVDIPWGVMELEKDQPLTANRNWMAMQRWLDISNDTKGVTWCSLDAPLFESGTITANILGDGINNTKWITKLEPSAAVYSWVMNNHWFTNFPLTQDGPVAFRYRIHPHGTYDAAAANRFGMEQAQMLTHVAANHDPAITPLITIDNDRVMVTILKPIDDGKATIVRLRSLSDKEETVRCAFPAGKPKSFSRCPVEETPGEPVGESLRLPAFGQMTLRAEFLPLAEDHWSEAYRK